MNPYLQAVTQNSIVVMVETDTKDPVFVQYGKTSLENSSKTKFYLVTEDKRSQTYVHRVYLENLEPNTEYKYRAVHKKDTSSIFTFKTAVPEGVPFRVAIMGDNRSNPEKHSKKSKKMAQHSPHISIYTGDLCFAGRYFEWKQEFFTPEEQELIARVPFFNSLGNHEAQTELTKVFLQAPKSSSNDEYYYSFDYGDAHFLILNTETNVSPGSPQWKFAESDLANTNKKWKIVAFHIPAYSFGKHPPNKKMQEMTTQIFEKYGVDLVLNGHNHFYQRNLVNGIYHITTGGGGSPLYEPTYEGPYIQKSVKDYHYGIMDISKDSIVVKIYDLRDKIIDEFTIKK
ncbi:MAG: metallophosphoesterase family protein [Ignavibacteria bacterium]|nr:metallophosphoesterase family protein [Ignavibacteria bacterium]